MIFLFRDEEEYFIKINFYLLFVNNFLRKFRKEKCFKCVEKYLLIFG